MARFSAIRHRVSKRFGESRFCRDIFTDFEDGLHMHRVFSEHLYIGYEMLDALLELFLTCFTGVEYLI